MGQVAHLQISTSAHWSIGTYSFNHHFVTFAILIL